ncbi:AtzH-like domain-containing protein [Krasilnikovia sp. MM14-A1259]|uniref:AtzH-like domain-containing protein n=1 Tax=Krasilnikovia sp. MM14-A1259 TaxID=3373539 RepID=UPI0037F6DE92
MQVNQPAIVAEVGAIFEAYEQALVAGEADRIVGFFAPDAVRFGIADRQIGLAEQAAWRRAQPPLPPGRRLKDTIITTYGADIAVVTTLFGYPDTDILGRQSQTWVRLPHGWRIITAHVSNPGHT